MSFLRSLVRNAFARFGYTLAATDPRALPPLADYLRSLRAGDASPLAAVVFDDDASVQAELLRVLPAERVGFLSPTGTTGSHRPAEPAGRFLAAADLGRLSPETLLAEFPWLRRAEVWLLRAPLGAFWCGELDLTAVGTDLGRSGLSLSDVLGLAPRSALQAPASNMILVATANAARSEWHGRPARETAGETPAHFQSHGRDAHATSDPGATARVAEALAFLSAPIAHRRDFQILAGRNAFGFAAGVYNPGAVMVGGMTRLLARAETAPWAVQKISAARYFSSSAPLILRLDAAGKIAAAAPLALAGGPDPAGHRAEDFRLFEFRGEIFSNHAVISQADGAPGGAHPLDVDRLRTRVGLSKFDPEKPALTWCGFPALDRPLDRTEKNWAMFADGDRLFMLYSFAPYALFAADRWPALDFTPVLETALSIPVGDPGLAFRNSVNPVPYDDDHWLHVVHQVYPGKQYVFWAVLLSRRTLRPARISARPLVRAWHGCAASIVYVSSVIAGPAEIRLFAGLDDSATAIAAVPRARLDAEWIAFPDAAV